MVTFLTALSGLAWTIVYLDSIRIGLKQRTYAMPLVALALNIGWEWIYGLHGLLDGLSLQGVVNVVWAVADAVIVYTYLRFGRRELPDFLSGTMFAAFSVLVFATGFLVQWMFVVEFDWHLASRYSAFLQNLLMSGLFVAMFAARRGVRGQTMTIAVAKWIGTLAPTIVFGAYEHSAFILTLGILCSAFDLVYIGLLWWARRQPAFAAAPTSVPADRLIGVD
ncbi:hypothetical protein HDA40_000039 [Hamadaea flava]|uniref:Uncharacterized protein n=1 Tax=Hamadaea flava TaxID=1742688 RepID=A0ABV8LM07_9ACTN|nr:hypothetical protein [Hamadaea flava]MCP2321532.1 hypothetical protein [Hamadaea flava]